MTRIECATATAARFLPRRVGNRYELSRQNVAKLRSDLDEGWRWPERDDWGEAEFDPGDLMI